jgi:protoheme IX farnesyltransferase
LSIETMNCGHHQLSPTPHTNGRSANTAYAASDLVKWTQWSDVVQLTKPRIVLMVVVTVAAGFWVAVPSAQATSTLFHLLLGTALVAAGTNGLNQVAERDIDGLMHRTRNRPVPSGRMSASQASVAAWLMGVAGVGYLAVLVGLLVAALAALTLVSYVFVYTPLKRHSSVSILVGAVPGALPIAGGWTAATGNLNLEAWVLFWILFLWQLPHFLALGWLYREDYARADLKVISLSDPDGRLTFGYATVYAALLVPVSLIPALLGIAGQVYLVGALFLSLGFLVANAAAVVHSTPLNARRAFRVSLAYLPMILTLMVVSRGS